MSRCAVGALVRVVLLGLVVAGLIAGAGGDTARAATPAQAGSATAVVIVDTGGGARQVVIHFDGTISGLTALQLAGANPVTIGYGALGQAVCQLFGSGDPTVPGQCPGGWVYYRAVGGAGGWTQSSLGASNTTVRDGDVEGWKYGGGQPPFASFCSVVGCAPPPTDPPPTAPPATSPAPPAADTAPPVVGGATATTAPSSSKTGKTDDGASVSGSTGNAASTTPAADDGGESGGGSGSGSRRSQLRSEVALPAGSDSGGDSGSPIGVIVAVAVVAAGAGAGLWLRRRRRGPAPG